MSRSFKKFPIRSVACHKRGSMKEWKNQCNRKIRDVAKDFGEEIYSHRKQINRWTAPDDGKSWRDDPKAYRK